MSDHNIGTYSAIVRRDLFAPARANYGYPTIQTLVIVMTIAMN